ncbi:hypothetical protein Tco_0760076 [Tanacetum coccineum]
MGCTEEIENMLEIKVYEAGSQEDIFSSQVWRRVFDINEPIYTELCHEFYSTYDFDEVCANDELRTKKVIKFRLYGRAHSLTLLEFARRLGLYHSDEVNEEGFDVYFQGGLRSDENFNNRDYWLIISQDEELHLSRSLASTIKSPILRMLQNMITYGLCQRTIGYNKVQKNELWLMSMFEAKHQNGYANLITKMAKQMRVLTDEVLNSLSASTYYKALDTTTLIELIDSKGRLIPEDTAPGVPHVAIPRGPRPSIQDLYDRMGSMEIHQGAIERMAYRQSYHWDKYHGVFEHMAGVYDVPLQGAYNLPSYDQQQYKQQQDDEE